MVFYTCADAAHLPYARCLGGMLKQHPDATVYLVMCDRLPPEYKPETEPFDKVLLSTDLIAEKDMSPQYWHFLHTPEAICEAMKLLAAEEILGEEGVDGVVYLSPNTSALTGLGYLSGDYDIFLSVRSELTEGAVDPSHGIFAPSFFALRGSADGKVFAQRLAQAATDLWRTGAPLTAGSYNALLDMAPAMVQKACMFRGVRFDQLPGISIHIPNIYECYDNGEPITAAHREKARIQLGLFEPYAQTDPFRTEDEDCLYKALRKSEEVKEEGLYWEEYQEVVNSSSYRFGRKIMDLACKIAPPDSKRRKFLAKLRGGSAAPALEEVVALPPTPEDIDFSPITLEQLKYPMFSVLLHSCKDFASTYAAIASIASGTPGSSFEILVSGSFSELDRTKLTSLIPGLNILETDKLADMLNQAKGKYALLMGEHMRMESGGLSDALIAMEKQGCAIMQSALHFADGTIYEAGGVMTQTGRRISYGFGLNHELGCVRYRKEIDCASLLGTYIDLGAVKALEEGCRDDLSNIYALADLSFKLRREDKQTIYLPSLTMTDRRTAPEAKEPFAPAGDAYTFTVSWADVLVQENIEDESQMFLGRDRSVGKKTIFSVDDNIPCYDLSAGDRTTYHYYEVMAGMGYNLKIVGDDYARREPYATKLEAMGIEVVAADGGGEVEYRQFLKDNGKFIDTAYLNRPNNLQKYYDIVKKYCGEDTRVVYCCMDLHFLRELREHEVNGNKKEAARVKAYAKEEIARMDKADVVFDVSTYEKSILDKYLKHAIVEVNPIFVYQEFPEAPTGFDERKDLLFVGSFKHPGNLDGVDWMCKEVMPLILKQLPDVKLHLVGAHPTPAIEALQSDHVILHGYLSDEDLAQMYKDSRLSVVPLRFGAGVKGKVLEAMYNGLPIVSTAIGTEGIIDIEDCIENTDSAEDFANKVAELYNDTDRLQEMGVKNWQYVQDHLGVEPARELFRRSF